MREAGQERQAWAPRQPPTQVHYKLSSIEDTQRRRLHLQVNHAFVPYTDAAPSVALPIPEASPSPALALLTKASAKGGAVLAPEDTPDEADPTEEAPFDRGGRPASEAQPPETPDNEPARSTSGRLIQKAMPFSLRGPVPSGEAVATGHTVVEAVSWVTLRRVVGGRLEATDDAIHFVSADGSKARSWCALCVLFFLAFAVAARGAPCHRSNRNCI
jgi:hypothetical protein